MDTSEKWKPVVGYEGAYEVSDLGRVRSVDRQVWNGRVWHSKSGRTLSVFRGNYSKVRLKVNGDAKTRNVHTLVAEAFIGERPDGLEVCHGNGDPHDNRASNLRYDTKAANSADRVKHGTAYRRRNKSACFKGHDYEPGSYYVDKQSGKRVCLACERERSRLANARKTTCKRGHPLTEFRADGRRCCKTCARDAWNIHREREKTA